MGGPSQYRLRLAKLQARIDLPPTNAQIAELLSREASEASYVLQRAYRRAARSAFLWEVEARDLVAQKRPLTELAHIGPFLQKQIRQWIRRKRHPPRLLGAEFTQVYAARAGRALVPAKYAVPV